MKNIFWIYEFSFDEELDEDNWCWVIMEPGWDDYIERNTQWDKQKDWTPIQLKEWQDNRRNKVKQDFEKVILEEGILYHNECVPHDEISQLRTALIKKGWSEQYIPFGP